MYLIRVPSLCMKRIVFALNLNLGRCLFLALVAFGVTANLGMVYYAAMPFIAGALIFEHRSAQKLDLPAINRAFFQSNAFVSALFVTAVAADRWL